jgi:hypothetical protein
VVVSFICSADAGAGQATIPPEVLLSLPRTSLLVLLYVETIPQTVMAKGFDWGFASANTLAGSIDDVPFSQ